MNEQYQITQAGTTVGSKDLASFLVKEGQMLLPMVELVEKSEVAIDDLVDVMGRATIEAVLQMSAEQIAGPKQQGKTDADRQIHWYGSQTGRVALKERQLRVSKPRLRKKRAAAKSRSRRTRPCGRTYDSPIACSRFSWKGYIPVGMRRFCRRWLNRRA